MGKSSSRSVSLCLWDTWHARDRIGSELCLSICITQAFCENIAVVVVVVAVVIVWRCICSFKPDLWFESTFTLCRRRWRCVAAAAAAAVESRHQVPIPNPKTRLRQTAFKWLSKRLKLSRYGLHMCIVQITWSSWQDQQSARPQSQSQSRVLPGGSRSCWVWLQSGDSAAPLLPLPLWARPNQILVVSTKKIYNKKQVNKCGAATAAATSASDQRCSAQHGASEETCFPFLCDSGSRTEADDDDATSKPAYDNQRRGATPAYIHFTQPRRAWKFL